MDSLQRIAHELTNSLSEAFGDAGDCHLIDYPLHYNVGDAAIWLGQRASLAKSGVNVLSVSSERSYTKDRIPGTAPLAILGGGHLGGLYKARHQLKLQVLADFPNRPVIQLPASVEYPNEQSRDELRRAFGGHPDATIMVRDTRSYDIAVRDFDCKVILSPDIAFGLGKLQRRQPRVDLAALVRTDAESADEVPLAADFTFDWLVARPFERRRAARLAYGIADLIEAGRHSVPPDAWFGRASDSFAAENLRQGVRLLSTGRRLVTDRLHGHLLACLLGIPHVVVADKYGKVEALWSTWSHTFPEARFVASWKLARDALASLN